MSTMIPIGGRTPEGTGKIVNVDSSGNLLTTNKYKDRLDKIVDIVGADYIKMFLTFSETDGVYKCAINPEISFSARDSINNYTHVEGGPFGHYIQKGANDDVLLQNHIDGYTGGSTPAVYATKYATKIKHIDGLLSMAKIDIAKVGTVSGDASYKVMLYTDVSGKPGVPVPPRTIPLNGRNDPVSKLVGYTGTYTPVCLLDDLPLGEGETYWLVFEYVDSTGIDANNHITWKYGTDANGTRAYWDGSDWVTVSGESFNYKLYNDRLMLPEDWTYISLIKHPRGNAQLGYFGITNHQTDTPAKPLMIGEYYGKLTVTFRDESGQVQITDRMAILSEWCTLAMSFGKYDHHNKACLYHNGKHLDTRFTKGSNLDYAKTRNEIFGAATSLERGGNYYIGRSMLASGNTWGASWGIIAPMILVGKKLSQEEISEISRLMLKGDD